MSAGVYVHTPFCVTKCPYCDFYSGVFPDELIAPFVAAIETEIDLRAEELSGPVQTVFVGGGTPTAMPPGALARILGRLDDRIGIATGAEITAESNPESLTDTKVGELLAAGVNRLSVGVQSLDAGVLACRPGGVTSACDVFRVTVHGRGGHGARPSEARSPILAGGQLACEISRLAADPAP